MGLTLKARPKGKSVSAISMSNTALAALTKPKNKFNARKTGCWNGHRHDSVKEAHRCEGLGLLEKAGDIRSLGVHPKFRIVVGDVEICRYVADFHYWELDGKGPQRWIVEDCKGVRTAVYKLKKKLVKAIYGIDIRET